MLSEHMLKDLLHKETFSNADKILLCLGVDVTKPKSVNAIRILATTSGLRAAKTWNISALLARSKGLAIRTTHGWELTADGRAHVSKLSGPLATSPVPKAADSLRTHLSTLPDSQTVAFVEEAIRCLEVNLFRAAVVLSWVGAVSVLYEYVVAHHLTDFNTEASRRDPKWKTAKVRDDLARMREADFLDILDAISVLGKNVKTELKKSLDLRNACGHPSILKIGEHTVAAHIELLVLNVFSQFKP